MKVFVLSRILECKNTHWKMTIFLGVFKKFHAAMRIMKKDNTPERRAAAELLETKLLYDLREAELRG